MKLKPRLDELLVERGLFDDIHEAQAAVLAGEVVVGDHRVTQAGRRLDRSVTIRVKGKMDYASRGGYKLAAGLDAFGVSASGMTCLDLGASTGGFTDCLLGRGALKVVAVDVGEPAMKWELQTDSRVDYHPHTDVRGFDAKSAGGPFDICVADLSFISLTGIVCHVVRFLKRDGVFVSLIKPQFEVAKEHVGHGGIVRDAALHAQAVRNVFDASAHAGLAPCGLAFSPITGAKGNIEFLYMASAAAGADVVQRAYGSIEGIVRDAHEQLGGKR